VIPSAQKVRTKFKNRYQLVVIGGGIYGAALAWEAAHRGVEVLLAEGDDFASGSSSNSLKIIHGGVRYLQQFDLARSRASANERRAFLRIAPHLVKPLPCTLPASGKISSGRLAVAAGMALYNAISFDRNAGLLDENTLPPARLTSMADLNHTLPPLAERGVTGAALWYDAQAWHTERLVIAFLRSAANVGAVIQNYLKATEFATDSGQISSVTLRDHDNSETFEVAADAVVDCSSGSQFMGNALALTNNHVHYARGINLVIGQTLLQHGMGVRAQGKSAPNRLLFLTPWRDCTLAGTWYLPWDGTSLRVNEQEIKGLIEELNSAFQRPLLQRQDIVDCHVGLLPLDGKPQLDKLDTQLLKHNQQVDLSVSGMEGAYILRGTKYTMARAAAERAVDHLAEHHQWRIRPSQSAIRTIDGGAIDDSKVELAALQAAAKGKLSAASAREILRHFGSNAQTMLTAGGHNASRFELIPESHMPAVAINYVISREWCSSLADLVFRRIELRRQGRVPTSTLEFCCQRMASLLHWDTSEQLIQLQNVEQYGRMPTAPKQ
jgi:glycerol-3-phosphate dehydrogenase